MPQDLNPQDMDTALKIAIAVDKVIFDPKISKQLVAMMGQAEPVQALARAAAVVLKALQEKSKGAPSRGFGGFLKMIIQRLSELAQAAKLFKPDPAAMQQALAQAQQQSAPQQATQQGAPQVAPQGGLLNQPGVK